MKRRHLFVLPAFALVPANASATSFKDVCQDSIDEDVSPHCLQCYNADCDEAQDKDPESYLTHLRYLCRIVEEPHRLHARFIHVSRNAFERLAEELGVTVFGSSMTPWADRETSIICRGDQEDDDINIHGFDRWGRVSRVGHGANFHFKWSRMNGWYSTVSWAPGDIKVGEPVLI